MFEFKNGIKFILSNDSRFTYSNSIYLALMNNSLDVLILKKREDFEFEGHLINYELETEIKTQLRNLYRPIK